MPTRTLPHPTEAFKNEYPDVWNAFVQLGDKCHVAGPLDAKTRRLVKLALAIGAGLEGATHSALRSAMKDGVSPEEIQHVAVLGITTLGLPSAMRALTWIHDAVQSPDANQGQS
jgi:alkylhydroperoxidase/carboxymuconolactone decarboxylase family protein YurZ